MTPQLVNLIHFACFKENYRLIAIDLSKQTTLKDTQQINFTGKFGNQANGATVFSSWKNQKKLLFNFYKILQASYKNGNSKICEFFKKF